MYNFTQHEMELIIEGLNTLLASNKRMQVAKPRFSAVFAQTETEITALKLKLQTPNKK